MLGNRQIWYKIVQNNKYSHVRVVFEFEFCTLMKRQQKSGEVRKCWIAESTYWIVNERGRYQAMPETVNICYS